MYFTTPHILALIPILLVPWWKWVGFQRHRLKLTILLVAIVALSQPHWITSQATLHLNLLLDHSESNHSHALAKAQEVIGQFLDDYEEEHLSIFQFAQGASIFEVEDNDDMLEALNKIPAEDESQLAAGLRLIEQLTPSGGKHEVLLISDGIYTGEDPLAITPALREKNIRINTMMLTPEQNQDTAILQAIYPSIVALGQPLEIAVEIYSPKFQTVELFFKKAPDDTIFKKQVLLDAGKNRFNFQWQPPHIGTHHTFLRLNLPNDTIPENNEYHLAVDVVGPPQILHLNPEGKETALSRALQSTQLKIATQGKTDGITTATLNHYDAVVMENMPLVLLNDEADRALSLYVQHFGGGLLMTGGRAAFNNGGYIQSQLKEIIPFRMERYQQGVRPKIALGVILDRSGSMIDRTDAGVTKMMMATQAASKAVESLVKGDQVCVHAVDIGVLQVVSLQTLDGAKKQEEIIEKIKAIEPGGGGIVIHDSLEKMIGCLEKSQAQAKHIILLTDAGDAEKPGSYVQFIKNWTNQKGGITVVGLGSRDDKDAGLLKHMAQLGNGRVYFTKNPEKLPEIFVDETHYLTHNAFVQQTTPILPVEGLKSLGAFDSQIPSIGGYNMNYLAKEASELLRANDEELAPLAAHWHRGLGKVLAVAFEADGPFTGNFAQWEGYKPFFRKSLEWVLRKQRNLAYYANMELQGRKALVTLEFDTAIPSFSQTMATIVQPSTAHSFEVPLYWEKPGRLIGEFPVSDEDIYQGVVQIPGETPALLPPIVLPFPPEYSIGNQQHQQTLMEQLALSTGGQEFQNLETLIENSSSVQTKALDFTPYLAILLLFLLIADIGQRKGAWMILWESTIKRQN